MDAIFHDCLDVVVKYVDTERSTDTATTGCWRQAAARFRYAVLERPFFFSRTVNAWRFKIADKINQMLNALRVDFDILNTATEVV